MTELLQKSNRLGIMMEFFPYLIEKHRMNPEQYISLFNNNNWKIFILNRRKKKITPINMNELLKKNLIENKVHPNLLCLKGIN